ncbi:type IV secretion system protein VirD4 [Faecalicatena contorta]|uniref:Type IV secretion system protein VirD4 n=1 Tax=Faecalicatena contorta TaxID=39482 RepID=A0A315ZRA3_9FIRM|nr:type IV secretion system protein VirD4 [Faecalicatena contorta]SUQ15813.1 type IV secretion system protein VirD4 [Faecalicatena contorta]
MSELLGKATIDVNTYGKSTGHSGNYSTNYQISGRELLTPDEVRMLDNRYALLFIRGERPIMDEKFDILKHPNVVLTTDGKGVPYRHGEVTQAVANISLSDSLDGEVSQEPEDGKNYELLSDEELETIFSEEKSSPLEQTE